MDISVQELTSVDKEITIKANREDLSSKFEKAFKKYQRQIQLPGFRPGNVPLGLLKKRFGKEIELEEINSYVQEVYEKSIVPEHEPVGETQMTDLTWENDELNVTFKVGAKPVFELDGLEKITVDKMVHDVTDEEVDEEIERTLERQGNWEETDGKITEENRVLVDAITLDENGEPVEGEKDEDQTLDLRQEGAKEFREHLVGKKAGDVVTMQVGEGEETDRFEIHVKKVEKLNKAKLTDQLAQEQSNGEAKNVDAFKSFIKSRMQQYYDQSSDEMFREDAIRQLTGAFEFDIPEVIKEQILEAYVDRLKQQYGGKLPDDLVDVEEYKKNSEDRAEQEGKWGFISQKLQEKFDDIEITPEDIDEQLSVVAASYGVPVAEMKSVYAQNPSMLENLRITIHENKVFDKLKDVVTINELSKEEFRLKGEKEREHSEK